MKSTKQVLTEAAALGRKVGVAKGEFKAKGTDKMCINGLIGAVIKGAPLANYREYDEMVVSDEFTAAVKIVAPIIGAMEHWGALANWNNDPTTTEEQVLSVLEKAAASL